MSEPPVDTTPAALPVKLTMQRLWHRAFQAGMVLKGFDGALEVAGGTVLLLTTQPAIQRGIALLTHEELIEDPHDFFANLLDQTAQHLSISTQHFAGVYLVGHGVIKIGLVIGMLRGLLWSYPLALLFLTAFILYQLYRLAHTHSIILSLFTAFDFAIALLIWREWQYAKTRRAPSDLSPQIARRAGLRCCSPSASRGATIELPPNPGKHAKP